MTQTERTKLVAQAVRGELLTRGYRVTRETVKAVVYAVLQEAAKETDPEWVKEIRARFELVREAVAEFSTYPRTPELDKLIAEEVKFSNWLRRVTNLVTRRS